MSAFLSDLIITPHPNTKRPDGRNWRLVEDLVYSSDQFGLVLVPQGFITDFASVPAFLWSKLPPWGRYGSAAILHDQVYWMHGTGSRTLTREEADALLLEAMTASDVSALERQLIYDAVRAFGQSGWDDDQRRADAGERHVE